MNPERTSLRFYQHLGKVFYAVAAADKKIEDVEISKLKELVKNVWLAVDDYEDDYATDAAFQIEIVFDWLLKEEKLDASRWFDQFVDYYTDHNSQFSNQVNSIILKTAHAIAASFAGKNKSELMMLARLDILLKNKITN